MWLLGRRSDWASGSNVSRAVMGEAFGDRLSNSLRTVLPFGTFHVTRGADSHTCQIEAPTTRWARK